MRTALHLQNSEGCGAAAVVAAPRQPCARTDDHGVEQRGALAGAQGAEQNGHVEHDAAQPGGVQRGGTGGGVGLAGSARCTQQASRAHTATGPAVWLQGSCTAGRGRRRCQVPRGGTHLLMPVHCWKVGMATASTACGRYCLLSRLRHACSSPTCRAVAAASWMSANSAETSGGGANNGLLLLACAVLGYTLDPLPMQRGGRERVAAGHGRSPSGAAQAALPSRAGRHGIASSSAAPSPRHRAEPSRRRAPTRVDVSGAADALQHPAASLRLAAFHQGVG